jgi:hypothetical protein
MGDQKKHGGCCKKVITAGEGTLVWLQSATATDRRQSHGLFFVPGHARSDAGSVEVFQRPNPRPAVERDTCVRSRCELAGDYLKTHHLRLFTDRQVRMTQLSSLRVGSPGSDPRSTKTLSPTKAAA